LFEQIRHHTSPKWLAVEEIVIPGDEGIDAVPSLLSPNHASAGSLLGLIPMLSFETVSSSGTTEQDLEALDEVTASMHQSRKQFSTLKTRWVQAFAEDDSGYSLLVQDLQKVHQLVLTQATALGIPGESAPNTVWESLATVQQTVDSGSSSMHQHAAALEQLVDDHNTLTQSVIALESSAEDGQTSIADKVNTVTNDVRALEHRML
jgi:hypothetical protein